MPKLFDFRFPQGDIFSIVTILNWKDPLKYFFFCFRTASLGGNGLIYFLSHKRRGKYLEIRFFIVTAMELRTTVLERLIMQTYQLFTNGSRRFLGWKSGFIWRNRFRDELSTLEMNKHRGMKLDYRFLGMQIKHTINKSIGGKVRISLRDKHILPSQNTHQGYAFTSEGND